MSQIDPNGLMEFSVVFTDRSLNHMSKAFQGVMTDISTMLKDVYQADHVALVPGGGTYGMEAVAHQFGNGAHAMIVRNG
ncbi:MAG: aspartate aminotransferase-like enzyme [Yoonia sp.]|jgi:aspartate aminotransferase-like enzyme